jgi:polysaccharide chain length determinant protein (PEP-CTERM system associated)
MTSGHSDHRESGVGYDFALEVWQRRKWVAVPVFLGAFGGMVSLALSLPDLYRATATVLVERQQVSEAVVRPSITTELETRIQTIHKQVTSRARLTDVIRRFDLYPELRGYVPIEGIVERMRRDIDFGLSGVEQQITGRPATIAFSVSYSGRDRETVAEVANTLVASYVEENTRTRERQAIETAELLKTKLNETKQELDAQEQRERAFTLTHTSDLPQQVAVNLSALERLNTQLRLNGDYQVRAMERRERLEHQLADADTRTPYSEAATSPATQLPKLRQQLAELRGKYNDLYPDIVRLKAEIAALGEAEEQGEAVGTNGHSTNGTEDPGRRLTQQSLGQVQKELEALKKEEGYLRRLIADYELRVENAPRRQEELEQLSRDKKSTRERYEALLKRYEEAQLAESLEQGQKLEQLRVLDPAFPPIRPSAPNRLWLLAIGFAGAMALAFVAVVAVERLDTSFHTADDLRAFVSVPMLAAIRRIPTRGEVRRGWLRPALVTMAVVTGVVLIVGGAYYVGSGNEQIARMTARTRQ